MKINEYQKRVILTVCSLLSVAIIYSPTVRCISGKCTPVGDFDFLWGRMHGERPDFLFVAVLWTGVLVVGGLLYFLFGQNDERKDNKNRVQTYRVCEEGLIQPEDQSKAVEGLLVARVPSGNHREIKIPSDFYEKSDIRLAVLIMLCIVVAVPIILFTNEQTKNFGEATSVRLSDRNAADAAVSDRTAFDSAGMSSDYAHIRDRADSIFGEIKIVSKSASPMEEWVVLGSNLLLKDSFSGFNKIIKITIKPEGSVNVFILGQSGASGRFGTITAIEIKRDGAVGSVSKDTGGWSEGELSEVVVGQQGEIYGLFSKWIGHDKVQVKIDSGVISKSVQRSEAGDYEREACDIAYKQLANNACRIIEENRDYYSFPDEVRRSMENIKQAYFFSEPEYAAELGRVCGGGDVPPEAGFYEKICVFDKRQL